MNDESFHTVYDCSRFRVIRWCRGGGGVPKNNGVCSRSKLFCNLTEFLQISVFQEMGGGHGPLDFFYFFCSESFINLS